MKTSNSTESLSSKPRTKYIDNVYDNCFGFEGYLDGIKDDLIWGWAWYPNEPTKKVVLELLIDDELIAEINSDKYRQDLHDKNIGDGNYSFSKIIPIEFYDGKKHRIILRDKLTKNTLGSSFDYFELNSNLNDISYNFIQNIRLGKIFIDVYENLNTDFNQKILDQIYAYKQKLEWLHIVQYILPLIKEEPQNILLYIECAVAYREEGLFDEGLALLKQANENNLDSIWLVYIRTQFYYNKKLYRKALSEANKLSDYAEYNKQPDFFNALLIQCNKKYIDINNSSDSFLRDLDAIDESGLFDAYYYKKQLDNDPQTSLLEHYLTSGWNENKINPNSLFDAQWYSQQHQLDRSQNPLLHYIYIGIRFHFSPSEQFYSADYIQRYMDEMRKAKITDPLSHYIHFGKELGFTFKAVPINYINSLSDTIAISKIKKLFIHTEFIRQQILSLNLSTYEATIATSPLLFYKEYGSKYSLRPHPIIDEDYLSEQLNCSKESAFSNFLSLIEDNPEFSPTPLFDVDYYLQQLSYHQIVPDISLISHYLSEGWQIGLDPHPLFDSEYYRNIVGISHFDEPPLTHYLVHAHLLKGDPSPFIDEKFYNHNLHTADSQCEKPSVLHDFLLRDKWISFHPDISQQSIGQLHKPVPLDHIADRDKQISHSDFVDLIRSLRSFTWRKVNSNTASTNDENIDISVIILNYNRLIHTMLSSYCAYLALEGLRFEMIIVDNGSDYWIYENLSRYLNPLPNCRVIRLERNRFFGEGNNIALDIAKGDYISFLNNDAYVNRNTYTSLLKKLNKNKEVGAVAPVFALPNYTLQEVGGKVSSCGQVIQIGKHTAISKNIVATLHALPDSVDYCSAACCLIRHDVLKIVGGFDYIFEPFYYEDTDLFSRIRCLGYLLHIDTDSHVVHFENTSTMDYLKSDTDFYSLINTNRNKFSRRWFDKLGQGSSLDVNLIPRAGLYSLTENTSNIDGLNNKPHAVIYSPFTLGPGGGEKYLITLASALTRKYHVTMAFSEIHSSHRLKMVAEDLDVSPRGLSLLTWDDILRNTTTPDLLVVMGNEILPPVPAIGKNNFYHCQFPFPINNMQRSDGLLSLNGYEGFVVNSCFTQREIEKQLRQYALPLLPVHVINPPCWDGNTEAHWSAIESKIANRKPDHLSIVNVGRFFLHGHNKRQDIVLDIVEQLHRSLNNKQVDLNAKLLGGVSKSDEEYFNNLASRANSLNVEIYSNVERREIDQAYYDADIYLHAAGFGHCEAYSPHELEHFGITIVEALVNGLIPVVYKAGGPYEILREIGVGEVYKNIDEASEAILRLSDIDNNKWRDQLRVGLEGCQRYSTISFNKKVDSTFDS